MNISKKTLNIWKKNAKQGYHFFQPNKTINMIPRTLREAESLKLRKIYG